MSSVSALEQTSSWQDSVLITAARMAASRPPAIQGLNSCLDSSMNTVSALALTAAAPSGWAMKYGMPTKPTATAPIRHRIIQVMLMRRALGMVSTEEAAMKRTRMCGWPK